MLSFLLEMIFKNKNGGFMPLINNRFTKSLLITILSAQVTSVTAMMRTGIPSNATKQRIAAIVKRAMSTSSHNYGPADYMAIGIGLGGIVALLVEGAKKIEEKFKRSILNKMGNLEKQESALTSKLDNTSSIAECHQIKKDWEKIHKRRFHLVFDYGDMVNHHTYDRRYPARGDMNDDYYYRFKESFEECLNKYEGKQ